MMLKRIIIFFLFVIWGINISGQSINIPYLQINTPLKNEFSKAYRIALGDMLTNVAYHKGGLLKKNVPCLLAGLDYGKPWTRDASINIWNGFGLISPEVSKNTLLAQLNYSNNKVIIAGQYWDSVIWIIGAWQYYLFTGDFEFLKLAYNATSNTIQVKEIEEFDSEAKLFRGPAVYGDGVAAYPKIYAESSNPNRSGTFSGIEAWPENNIDKKVDVGYGIPMFALSTNCVYFEAYNLLSQISKIIDRENLAWNKKANDIKNSINEKFWNSNKGIYDYLVDPYGGSKNQESLGNAFAILFDIADEEKKKSIFENITVTENGIPCLFPVFERYSVNKNYGRHSGTIWPHIQGFWAQACIKSNYKKLFFNEYKSLTDKSFRDNQFVEIYHPISGQQYGGLQEPTLKKQKAWDSTNRQTWSATAYLRMVLYGLLGLDFQMDGVTINPKIPLEFKDIIFDNLHYRDMILNISIIGNGKKFKSVMRNGELMKSNFISSKLVGIQNIVIVLEN